MKVKVCMVGGMQSEAISETFATRHTAALSYVEELQSKPVIKNHTSKTLLNCLFLIKYYIFAATKLDFLLPINLCWFLVLIQVTANYTSNLKSTSN